MGTSCLVRSSHKTSTGDLLVRLVGVSCPHAAYLSLRDHSDEVRASFYTTKEHKFGQSMMPVFVQKKIYNFVCGQTRRWSELQRNLASW